MDEAASDALAQRIEHQGWDQGCFVALRHWVFIANADAPTSELGAQVAAQQDIDTGPFVAHAEAAEQIGVIVTSQVCDLVAAPDVEPFCEAMALVRVPDDQPLPQANSTRGFVVDAGERLVAEGSYRLYFEKSLLPDEQATQLLDEERRRPFAAWLGRRSSRAAFPNDFVATVGRAIDRCPRPCTSGAWASTAMTKTTFTSSSPMTSGRSRRTPSTRSSNTSSARFESACRLRSRRLASTNRPTEEARRSGSTRSSTPTRGPQSRSSMRVMLSMPPFNLEHLTYASDVVSGAESHVELEG